ncbi:MAG: hypothetical protein F9K40_12305 [Kofleriaceae bacterium]|nr:MAG: hypothetical protein F9K40_12305 [Kofleriaceae bacterium]MBZ0238994.1 hypothetical protein [Kofleriaceae bacterium]
MLGFLLPAAAGCGGTQVPQHSGYKKPKSKPWEKPKVLKLEENAAKAGFDLDYARYKRARWLAVDLPGPGTLDVQMEVTPSSGSGGQTEEGEELDIDVGLEIVDGTSWNVLAKSDLEADDAHELKKQRTLKELPEGRYLVHVYLQGRLDAADVDVKVGFARGAATWKSDFPNQVAFVGPLAAIPPLDDSPEEKKPTRPTGPRPPRPPKPPTTPDPPPGGGGAIMAEISDIQPDASGGTIITIAGGTADGLENGLKGNIKGVRNSSFSLSGCSASTCRATVKAAIDDVRGSAGVIIKLK